MTEQELMRVRIALLQAFLREHNLDGILLSRTDNFAMATGGRRNYVGIASDTGACSLFVNKNGDVTLITNNIEEPRIMEEELSGCGCTAHRFLWFEGNAAQIIAKEYSGAFVSDDGSVGDNVNSKLAYLRALLTPLELEKYRLLGQLAAEAMTATLSDVKAGMSEADIAARLIAEGAKRRCLVPVCLVAADARIAQYRHPLPTCAHLASDAVSENCVRGYVMVVGGFVREGLTVSITRFKRVGDVKTEILEAENRICGVDAMLQEACEPGKTLADVFSVCQRAYRELGFVGTEWHNHHQGGTTGYAGRTFKGSPHEMFPILDELWSSRVKEIAGIDIEFGHAFAWNPSAPGVKSEDTFLLYPDGTKQIVTLTPAFPTIDLEAVLERPTPVVKSGFLEA
ncbi:MAG: M24 family metallopeptidase [Candidatus Hydrogenedentes bacterium]|nr:M24 family metallopeptidase [Candidatus Hydrogenedentota bacterium]